ncbi:hypothetical protein H696_05190 [Fonticula alba]|uniref:Cysteine dioxygenase n=1 Tax=Fonticula alba TaxID=691883 RepID=A0A058Z2V6_FONAL|nr:hypothetical protein H696_05190 [Fonticula alba]KCV68268.1 hypothetical protein H696_05190 [Fonticula alba]|eukprot:XP_009497322.1 hypothetical protein H696_05190 [Fonticula alba]
MNTIATHAAGPAADAFPSKARVCNCPTRCLTPADDINFLDAANPRHTEPLAPEDEPTTPTSIDHLRELLKAEFDNEGISTLCYRRLKRVRRLMQLYTPKPEDYAPYAHFRDGYYTRNLVDDGNGHFNLIVLAWAEGQGSPVHDHSGSHCFMKVLDGTLEETLYHTPADEPHGEDHDDDDEETAPLETISKTNLGAGSLAYIHDRIGLHKVHNPSNDIPSLSLHLYSPPYTLSHAYNPKTGTRSQPGQMLFHSVGGQLVKRS